MLRKPGIKCPGRGDGMVSVERGDSELLDLLTSDRRRVMATRGLRASELPVPDPEQIPGRPSPLCGMEN